MNRRKIIKRRKLGAAGPGVAAIGLGCMGMSHAYGVGDDVESARTLERAVDLGVGLFDTADVYGMGSNEKLIGRVLGRRRDEIVIATKFGMRGRNGAAARSDAPTTFVDTSPEWVRQACDASLSRLGFDTIDLYYAHRRSPEVPVEDTVGAMAGLVAAGKVRHLGLSEVSVETLRAAHAVHPIAAVQMEYSLFTRDVEDGMLEACRELGVALVAYSPVGRGMLTGAMPAFDDLPMDDFRRGLPRVQGDNGTANLELAAAVRTVAADLGVTPAQAALAWLLARDETVIPIPGTKRVRYLEENVAAEAVELSEGQLARIEAAVPRDAVAGTRYAARGMEILGQ